MSTQEKEKKEKETKEIEMQCPRKCTDKRGEVIHMKLGENSTDIFMKCPKCGYAKGAPKNPKRR